MSNEAFSRVLVDGQLAEVPYLFLAYLRKVSTFSKLEDPREFEYHASRP